MANTTSPSRRSMTAAARAAAKRAQRAEYLKRSDAEASVSGPTLVTEAPDGWDDPPEPSLEPDVEPDGGASADSEESGTARRRPRLLTAVLGLLLVAGLVAASVLGWQYQEGQRAQEARGEALAAARKAAPVVLSYDYRHLDRDFARARTRLTGKFHDQYRKTTTSVVAPTAEKYHGVVKATVATASVVSASPDKVVVLLFVNQVTRSTQVSGSRVDLNRVRMTMSRTSEGWKVSAVDAL
jgi:Mce-associated membrane protein